MDPQAFQILTAIVSVVASGFAALGVLKVRGAVMEERVSNQGAQIAQHGKDMDMVKDDLSTIASAINVHNQDNERHLTSSFVKMCDTQHKALCDDIAAMKASQRRIENILLKIRDDDK